MGNSSSSSSSSDRPVYRAPVTRPTAAFTSDEILPASGSKADEDFIRKAWAQGDGIRELLGSRRNFRFNQFANLKGYSDKTTAMYVAAWEDLRIYDDMRTVSVMLNYGLSGTGATIVAERFDRTYYARYVKNRESNFKDPCAPFFESLLNVATTPSTSSSSSMTSPPQIGYTVDQTKNGKCVVSAVAVLDAILRRHDNADDLVRSSDITCSRFLRGLAEKGDHTSLRLISHAVEAYGGWSSLRITDAVKSATNKKLARVMFALDGIPSRGCSLFNSTWSNSERSQDYRASRGVMCDVEGAVAPTLRSPMALRFESDGAEFLQSQVAEAWQNYVKSLRRDPNNRQEPILVKFFPLGDSRIGKSFLLNMIHDMTKLFVAADQLNPVTTEMQRSFMKLLPSSHDEANNEAKSRGDLPASSSSTMVTPSPHIISYNLPGILDANGVDGEFHNALLNVDGLRECFGTTNSSSSIGLFSRIFSTSAASIETTVIWLVVHQTPTGKWSSIETAQTIRKALDLQPHEYRIICNQVDPNFDDNDDDDSENDAIDEGTLEEVAAKQVLGSDEADAKQLKLVAERVLRVPVVRVGSKEYKETREMLLKCLTKDCESARPIKKTSTVTHHDFESTSRRQQRKASDVECVKIFSEQMKKWRGGED